METLLVNQNKGCSSYYYSFIKLTAAVANLSEWRYIYTNKNSTTALFCNEVMTQKSENNNSLLVYQHKSKLRQWQQKASNVL